MSHWTELTDERKKKFLEIVIATGGNVTRACAEVDISRQTAYNHRESDPEFAKAWEDAVDKGIDVLEDEARRRAFDGVDEPVFYQGKEVAKIKRYSDFLMGLMLKANRKKYRTATQEITGPEGASVEVTVKYDDVKTGGNGDQGDG